MDKNELKVQALTEKIGNVVSNYENQIADIRADITIEFQRRDQEKAELEARIVELESASESVQEEAGADTPAIEA